MINIIASDELLLLLMINHLKWYKIYQITKN
jgi:hypothetical protein